METNGPFVGNCNTLLEDRYLSISVIEILVVSQKAVDIPCFERAPQEVWGPMGDVFKQQQPMSLGSMFKEWYGV